MSAKKKVQKASKAKVAIVGVAALAIIGAFLPSEEPEEEPKESDVQIVTAADVEQKTSEETKTAPATETVPDVRKEKEETEQAPATTPAQVESDPVVEPEAKPVVEADPEQAFRESLKQYFLVGSSESDRYHVPTCRWTSEITDSNLVHFDSYDEAETANYQPCGTCKPK